MGVHTRRKITVIGDLFFFLFTLVDTTGAFFSNGRFTFEVVDGSGAILNGWLGVFIFLLKDCVS